MSLEERIESLKACLDRLEDVLNQPKDEYIRDSAIKRFELCFELCWKTLKDYLYKQGVVCKSPKACLREAFSLGLIEDEEEWLTIIEDRNLSVHIYNEDLAEEIYGRLRKHLESMRMLTNKIADNL